VCLQFSIIPLLFAVEDGEGGLSQISILPDALEVLIQPDQAPSGLLRIFPPLSDFVYGILEQSKHTFPPDLSHEPYRAISGHIRKFGFLRHDLL